MLFVAQRLGVTVGDLQAFVLKWWNVEDTLKIYAVNLCVCNLHSSSVFAAFSTKQDHAAFLTVYEDFTYTQHSSLCLQYWYILSNPLRYVKKIA